MTWNLTLAADDGSLTKDIALWHSTPDRTD